MERFIRIIEEVQGIAGKEKTLREVITKLAIKGSINYKK